MCQNSILEKLNSISSRIVEKELRYSDMYAIKASEQVKREVLGSILLISQEIAKYKLMNKMKSSELESVVSVVKINEIMELIEILVENVEKKYYYYYEIVSSVIYFLESLKEEFKSSDFDMIRININIYKYQLSLEYQRNIKIKEHPEYDKISNLIETREQLIKFFHNKWKVQDYLVEELEELAVILTSYEGYMKDVDNIQDEKLKSIIFKDFFVSYEKKLDTLFFINGVYTA